MLRVTSPLAPCRPPITTLFAALLALWFLPVEARSQQQARDVAGPGSGALAWSGEGVTVVQGGAGSTLTLAPAAGPIRIDGRLDDAGWAGAEIATGFIQEAPNEGSPASQPTRVRMALGEGYLYVAAHLQDRAPDSIGTRMARRDEDVAADWFYVYFDSYGDRLTAFGFGVSAAGVQRDVRVSDDSRSDASWDAVWESAVEIGHDGWTAELRIPLSQLRYDADAASPSWGLNFLRRIARNNERSYWAPRPRRTDQFVSLFGELRGVASLPPARGIEVIPYAVTRSTNQPVASSDPFRSRNDVSGTMGADVRAGLGRGLTLTATVNPDFGQVEADPATVNLTAFETFQSERRPFFVEGSDIFDLAMPVWPPFFYSRRIGRRPQGSAPPTAEFSSVPEASTILGAAKVTGKVEGGWTVGFMEAVSGREEVRWVDDDGLPGTREAAPLTNHSVGRVTRELRDGRTGIGVLATATNRRITDPSLERLHSDAYGLAFDGWHRFAGDAWELRWGILGSHVLGSAEALIRTQRSAGHYFQRPDADHLTLDSSRTSLSGASGTVRLMKRSGNWRGGAILQATSPGYEIADFGFNPTLDHIRNSAWVSYQDYTPGRVLRDWSLRSNVMYQGTFGGEVKEQTIDLGFNYTLLNYWGGRVWVMRHRPAWEPDALRGGPALRKPGRWMGNVVLNSDRRRALSGRAFVFWEVADEGSGERLNGNTSLQIRPSDRLNLDIGTTLSYRRDAWQWVTRRSVDGEAFPVLGTIRQTTVSLPVRLDYTFTPDLTLQLYARPFLAGGQYSEFKEVRDPSALAFADRFRTWGPTEISTNADGGRVTYSVDRDGDGAADLSFGNPDFNSRRLQFNAVLRWQYRPGSTLFAVWTQDRRGFDQAGFRLDRDADRLLDAPARNVFMLKATWWIGL